MKEKPIKQERVRSHERARGETGRKEGGRHPLILRTHAVGKRTRAYLPQRPIHIHDPVCTHAQKALALASYPLLFKLVCTHIVRMHAINLYSSGEEERRGSKQSVECAGEVSALN